MNIHIARHKATLSSPEASAERKDAAVADLRSIAASDDARSGEAQSVLAEFGHGGEPSTNTESVRAISTETVQKSDSPKRGELDWIPTQYTEDLPAFVASYKSIVNNPSASVPEKAAAWKVINDPETELHRLVAGLEAELLKQAGKSHISAIDYGAVQEFCTAKGWTKIPTRLLYFDRWFPAYCETDAGSRKLATLERYWLMADARSRRQQIDDAGADILVEARRRIRTDAEFRKMLLDGVKRGEISPDYISTLTANIWQEKPEVTA